MNVELAARSLDAELKSKGVSTASVGHTVGQHPPQIFVYCETRRTMKSVPASHLGYEVVTVHTGKFKPA